MDSRLRANRYIDKWIDILFDRQYAQYVRVNTGTLGTPAGTCQIRPRDFGIFNVFWLRFCLLRETDVLQPEVRVLKYGSAQGLRLEFGAVW